MTTAVGLNRRCTTLEYAIKFERAFNFGSTRLDILGRCNMGMDNFCAFGERNKDVAFRDVYARDLTFRSTWLDFLTKLLVYIESLEACDPLTTPDFKADVARTWTIIENARKQLNIDRNNARFAWFARNKTRRKKALAAFGRSREDAGTLYNMRDILNEM